QIALVRLGRDRARAAQPLLLARRERQRDLFRDRACHLALQFEDIAQAVIVALGPQMALVAYTDQLHGDSHAIVVAAHAAVGYVADPEFAGDLMDILGP